MFPAHSRLRPFLMISAGLLTSTGLGAEWFAARSAAPKDLGFVQFFSLSYEQNLPTWYASSLLLACALALRAVAEEARRVGAPFRKHWQVLAIVFAYLSLDEAVGLHEHLAFFETSGVLYFSWVVPASALVVLLGLVFLPFVRALPPRLRRQVVLAGVVYVGGALGMELPLGWWTERHGNENLGYALIDHLEELLELIGAGLFLSALVQALEERGLEPSTEVAHGFGPAGAR